MTDAEVQMAAKAALEWANKGYAAALGAEIQIRAAEHGRKESEKEWDRLNPDDGVGCMSMNPFQGAGMTYIAREEHACKNTKRWRVIQEFVKERLCDMLKGDDNEQA